MFNTEISLNLHEIKFQEKQKGKFTYMNFIKLKCHKHNVVSFLITILTFMYKKKVRNPWHLYLRLGVFYPTAYKIADAMSIPRRTTATIG